MNRLYNSILTVFPLMIASAIPTRAFSQSVDALSVLIGTWSVEEIHASGWSEKGTRTCEWIMDSTYIQCETKAKSNGKERTYRFLINYNSQSQRCEMVGIYSNWPIKQHDAIYIESKTNWRLEEIPAINENTERRATIIFSDHDNYTWSGKNFNRTKNTTTVYTETGKRITP